MGPCGMGMRVPGLGRHFRGGESRDKGTEMMCWGKVTGLKC